MRTDRAVDIVDISRYSPLSYEIEPLLERTFFPLYRCCSRLNLPWKVMKTSLTSRTRDPAERSGNEVHFRSKRGVNSDNAAHRRLSWIAGKLYRERTFLINGIFYCKAVMSRPIFLFTYFATCSCYPLLSAEKYLLTWRRVNKEKVYFTNNWFFNWISAVRYFYFIFNILAT